MKTEITIPEYVKITGRPDAEGNMDPVIHECSGDCPFWFDDMGRCKENWNLDGTAEPNPEKCPGPGIHYIVKKQKEDGVEYETIHNVDEDQITETMEAQKNCGWDFIGYTKCGTHPRMFTNQYHMIFRRFQITVHIDLPDLTPRKPLEIDHGKA